MACLTATASSSVSLAYPAYYASRGTPSDRATAILDFPAVLTVLVFATPVKSAAPGFARHKADAFPPAAVLLLLNVSPAPTAGSVCTPPSNRHNIFHLRTP